MNFESELEEKDIIEFIKQEGSYQGVTTLSYRTIIGPVKISDLKITNNILFSNCIFKDGIAFHNIKLSNELNFESCTFGNGLIFSSIEKHNESSHSTSVIRINSGEIRGVLSFLSVNITKLTVQAISQIDVLNIEYSQIHNVNLYNISKIDSCSFIRIKVKNELELTRCNVYSNFNCLDSKIFELKFNTCEFNLPIILMHDFISVKFSIYECDFNEYVLIYSANLEEETNGEIRITQSRIKKDFAYYYEEENGKSFCHKNFYFTNNLVSDNFNISYLDGVIKGTQQIKHSLKNLELIFNNKNDGSYKFSNLNFENLTISGNNSKSSLQLVYLNCKNIYFKNLINLGTISMINCFKDKGLFYDKFKISGSLLNNLTMLNVDLNKFDSIEISESSLNGLKANNTIFFDFEKLNGEGNYQKRSIQIRLLRWFLFFFFNSKNQSEVNFWENKREVYKQLKLSMEQNGDRINSLKFKSSEMKAHRKYLILTKVIFNPDRIILGLSSINDFGLNWAKAAVICIIMMLSLYTILLVQINPILGFNFNWDYLDNTLKAWIENLNIFFQLLNPIHDVKKVYEGFEITNTTYLIDYISRITMSFFVFQIVSAFRKYIK